jgi:hypothetical protein
VAAGPAAAVGRGWGGGGRRGARGWGGEGLVEGCCGGIGGGGSGGWRAMVASRRRCGAWPLPLGNGGADQLWASTSSGFEGFWSGVLPKCTVPAREGEGRAAPGLLAEAEARAGPVVENFLSFF